MVLPVLLMLLHAAPVADAEKLAAKGDAEALFLKFGSAGPDDYDEADRARLVKALIKAARGARKDPFIAVGLAERAVILQKSPEALVVLAQSEIDLDQRESAARHLDEALSLAPKDKEALVARADLAMLEADHALAAELFERAKAAGAKDVAAKLAKARAEAKAKASAVDEMKRTEKEIQVRVATAASNATKDWLRQIVVEEEEATTKRRLAPDGVRQQEMRNFVFSYSAGSKTSADMMAFERKVERLLEKTYDFVSDQLNYKLEKRIPVSLQSREEYAQKHAGTPMSRAGGYWDGRQIVINGGAELDESFARVMVHEFTHAVVHDIAGPGRAPRWLNEGLAENMELSAVGTGGKPSERERQLLSSTAKAGGLPKLAELEPRFEAMSDDVAVAYAMSAQAVYLLVEQRGYPELLELLRDFRKGQREAAAVERRFMAIEELEERIADAVK